MIFAPLLPLSLGPGGRGTFPAFVQLDVFEFDQFTSTPPLDRGDVEDFAEIQVDPVGWTTGKGILDVR
jgi:hypothetical protein